MNNEQLPDYKKKFLEEMDVLRQQQLEEQKQEPFLQATQKMVQNQPLQNNILNTSLYSTKNWRQRLTTTSYNANHNLTNFDLNLLLNPQLKKKDHNLRHTPLTEYSNAVHNNSVFINPQFPSC